jgi:hypothetical protein
MIFFLKVKQGGKSTKKCLAVMENLFYQRNLSRIYDLKGSMRSRYVTAPDSLVLMDENLLEGVCQNMFWINMRGINYLGGGGLI